jgi:hypothetical protein
MKSELNNLKPPPRCLPVNLLDFLEADNSRLRRTVIELSLDVVVLRDALNGNGLGAMAGVATGTTTLPSDAHWEVDR